MSSVKHVLIIDQIHSSIISLLEIQGFQVDYRPDIKREQIIKVLPDFDGLIVRSKTRIDSQVLGKSSRLKFIARAGAGIDLLDVEAIESRGIVIINAPEGNRDALGEHALALLLNVMNNIRKGDMEIRRDIWDREGNRGFEVKGKTVGLIGYGFMGSAFAEKLSGLSCKVIAYDKYKKDFTDPYAEEASLERIFKESDILSLHVPLTEETRFMVDAAFFSNFKKGLVFLNTSRGEVVSLRDLITQLDDNHIRCAGLDVLENEKLGQLTDNQIDDFKRLKEMDNVILSPHVGGWTFESYERINKVLATKIKDIYSI